MGDGSAPSPPPALLPVAPVSGGGAWRRQDAALFVPMCAPRRGRPLPLPGALWRPRYVLICAAESQPMRRKNPPPSRSYKSVYRGPLRFICHPDQTPSAAATLRAPFGCHAPWTWMCIYAVHGRSKIRQQGLPGFGPDSAAVARRMKGRHPAQPTARRHRPTDPPQDMRWLVSPDDPPATPLAHTAPAPSFAPPPPGLPDLVVGSGFGCAGR